MLNLQSHKSQDIFKNMRHFTKRLLIKTIEWNKYNGY